ncbi:AMP-binding protein [Eggerthella lenta]|uniref:AMP-binding protein n=1 Tax=Eggerthella lenta TaxID=84112 RepID=UPI001F35C044|nr:AMP-binding protein [Eggerthella lenta]
MRTARPSPLWRPQTGRSRSRPAAPFAARGARRGELGGADLGGGTLHGRFFARAQAEPDAPALRWGADGEATYGELAGRALRIAGGLAAAGVGEGDRVAVRLPKLARWQPRWRAGRRAAYVPVGVSQPACPRGAHPRTGGRVPVRRLHRAGPASRRPTPPAPAGPPSARWPT